jgi:hypothetical protein
LTGAKSIGFALENQLNIVTRYYRRSRAEGFRPAADWQVEVTGGPLPSRCNPFLGQDG